MNLEPKTVFIKPSDQKILSHAVDAGFTHFFFDPADAPVNADRNLVFMAASQAAHVRLNGSEAAYLEVGSKADLDSAVEMARKGCRLLVIKALNWEVIPFENLIVELHLAGSKVYAVVNPAGASLALNIMEKGVDGVVVEVSSTEDLEFVKRLVEPSGVAELEPATVTSVRKVGLGDRVCVDTSSVLEAGEGLLVGNTSSFFFLIHNENIETEYAASRPFRVNAGGVHAYVLRTPDKTSYLSELRSGDELTVFSKGRVRTVVVGRVKIERRPLALIEAASGKRSGSVLVQWAETIRLVEPDGAPVSVTELKPGSKVLVHLGDLVGRHFGSKVDETIIEK